MSRETFVWDPAVGRVVPKSERVIAYAPKTFFDTCEIQSQIDGRIFTSKAGLRQHYRQSGVIEVGNETMERAAPDLQRVTRDDIRRHVWEHRNER